MSTDRSSLVNCLPLVCCTSTSAPIIPYYLPTDAQSKKVDYVIVVDPAHLTDATAATASQRINNIRRRLPELSINHCLNETLLHRPIAVSIETKRGGDNDREAQLQLGTWLAAQWNMLDALVDGATPAATIGSGSVGAGSDVGGDGSSCAGADDAVFTGIDPLSSAGGQRIPEEEPALFAQGSKSSPSVNKPSRLPFLPAMIVHGHDWSFVASTREGQKTVRTPRANHPLSAEDDELIPYADSLDRLSIWLYTRPGRDI